MRFRTREGGLRSIVLTAIVVVMCPSVLSSPSDPTAVVSDIVATVGGKSITLAELDQLSAGKLFKVKTDEYNLRRSALEALIDQRLIEAAAASRKMTADQFIKAEIEERIEQVTDDQVHTAYEGARDQYGLMPEDVALQRVRSALLRQHADDRRKQVVRELSRNAGVQVFLEPPRLTVSIAGASHAGSSHPKVTIVEFSDFECPFCSRAALTVRKLLNQHGDDVALYYRHLPLAIHANAMNAAKAGFCAAQQGRFWQMHDLLFSNQKNLSRDDLVGYARTAGLDVSKFEPCLGSPAAEAAVKADRDAALSYGVVGTPAFFVNGRLVAGNAPPEIFADLIADELQRANRGQRLEKSASK